MNNYGVFWCLGTDLKTKSAFLGRFQMFGHTKVMAKMKKASQVKNLRGFVFFGSSTWARTRDLRINSPALYQLSYRGTAKRAF